MVVFMCVGLYVSGRMCVTVSSVWGRFDMMRYLPTNVIVVLVFVCRWSVDMYVVQRLL